jgi:L-rhamnose mutarotase
MRIKITEKKVYTFNELTEDQKQKAIEKLYDINVDHEWWDCIYEDAKNVGIKITEFDLDGNRHAKIEFTEGAEYTAEKITQEHGCECETYKTAAAYIKDRTELVKKYSDGCKTDIVCEDNEQEFDNECDDLDSEFKKSIAEDYSILLQKEMEYLTGYEAIKETIEINEYEFDDNGNIA